MNFSSFFENETIISKINLDSFVLKPFLIFLNQCMILHKIPITSFFLDDFYYNIQPIILFVEFLANQLNAFTIEKR